MRDETGLSRVYLPRANLQELETLGLVVSVRALGLSRDQKPVTHLSLEVHRFLIRPIIRALPWPREHAMVGATERIAAQERHLGALRDAMILRLRRRLERLIAGEVWWTSELFDWQLLGGGWILCPAPFTGLEDRVWLGPAAERW